MYKISLSLSLQKKGLQSSIQICPRPMVSTCTNATIPRSFSLYVGREPEVKFITNCMKGIQRHFHILL